MSSSSLIYFGEVPPKPHVEIAYEGDSGYTGVNFINIYGVKAEQLLHR